MAEEKKLAVTDADGKPSMMRQTQRATVYVILVVIAVAQATGIIQDFHRYRSTHVVPQAIGRLYG